jgi:hypothetical protein
MTTETKDLAKKAYAEKLLKKAIDSADEAMNCTYLLVTWHDLTDDERDRYTRASNALELALCRLRGTFADIKPLKELL